MDQLICASLSHTHCWYEVGMLKVPAVQYYNYTAVIVEWGCNYSSCSSMGIVIQSSSDFSYCTFGMYSLVLRIHGPIVSSYEVSLIFKFTVCELHNAICTQNKKR